MKNVLKNYSGFRFVRQSYISAASKRAILQDKDGIGKSFFVRAENQGFRYTYECAASCTGDKNDLTAPDEQSLMRRFLNLLLALKKTDYV